MQVVLRIGTHHDQMILSKEKLKQFSFLESACADSDFDAIRLVAQLFFPSQLQNIDDVMFVHTKRSCSFCKHGESINFV